MNTDKNPTVIGSSPVLPGWKFRMLMLLALCWAGLQYLPAQPQAHSHIRACEACEGRGYDTWPEWVNCPVCIGDGGFNVPQLCPDCAGYGTRAESFINSNGDTIIYTIVCGCDDGYVWTIEICPLCHGNRDILIDFEWPCSNCVGQGGWLESCFVWNCPLVFAQRASINTSNCAHNCEPLPCSIAQMEAHQARDGHVSSYATVCLPQNLFAPKELRIKDYSNIFLSPARADKFLAIFNKKGKASWRIVHSPKIMRNHIV